MHDIFGSGSSRARFVWDPAKDLVNLAKHGVDFVTATRSFEDPHRKIFRDYKHSGEEERFFCIGKVGGEILTVRFLYRVHEIRIIGAGYWRKGRKYYEEEN